MVQQSVRCLLRSESGGGCEMKTNYQEELDGMLLIKAEKERSANTMPDVIEYEGKLYDTKKLLAAICEIFDRRAKAAPPGGVS